MICTFCFSNRKNYAFNRLIKSREAWQRKRACPSPPT